MRAGQLREKATFERNIETSDGGGGSALRWVPQFSRHAALAFAKLSAQLETIQQGELTVKTRATLTVREDSMTRTIQSEWRVRVVEDLYTTRVWRIGEIQRPARGWLRMTVETG